MAGLVDRTPALTYRDLLKVENNNSGVDDTLRQVESGNGTGSSLFIEKNSVLVKPTVDDSALLDVQDKDGGSKLKVDTSSDLVTALGHNVNTQYVYFGSSSSSGLVAVADTHYAIPFGSTSGLSGAVSFGTGGNPATSFTISTTADDLASCLWFIPDNIAIDAVHTLDGGSTADGEDMLFHVMAYTLDSSDSASGGDLSSGVVVADLASYTNRGYEQIYKKSMTIQSTNVDSGKVILCTVSGSDTNSNHGITITIKYHMR